jgi:catechol 2,3-dioxygenase-like lactoylglutathione lyase family enzyme
LGDGAGVRRGMKPFAALLIAAALSGGSWQAGQPPATPRLGSGQAAPARPRIAGIAHVAIQVSDLAKARAFYGGLLGFSEIGAKRAHTAVFFVNDRQRLIVRDGLPATRDERFIALAFETGVTAMRDWLAGRGIEASEAAADADAGGRRIETKDPDGHSVQFVELSRGARAPVATPERRLSRRILHAGLTIKDSAAADRFYKEALGFSETWRGGRPEGTINWINMRVPDGTDYLEYMLYPAAPPTRNQLGSAHHVALLVTDIQQALETVRARAQPGDRNHRANPNIGVNNRWQLNLFDPDGTRVELMEPWTVR